MHDRLESLLDDVDQYLEDATIAKSVKVSVRHRLQDINTDLLAVTDHNARERHLRAFIQREHRRTTAESGDDLPDGVTPRSMPLCECADPYCDLKRGTLPTPVQQAASLMVGVDRFQEDHPSPRVLLDARDDLRDKEARVADVLLECQIALIHETPVDELPEPDPGLEDGTEDGDTEATAD